MKSGKMQILRKRYFPHEYMYKMILSGVLEQYYEIPREDSWMIAAAEKNLSIVGNWVGKILRWEIFLLQVIIKGDLKASTTIWNRIYDVLNLNWYQKTAVEKGGFFQIGGELQEISQFVLYNVISG